MATKIGTHNEGVEYVKEYLKVHDIDTEIRIAGRRTYLQIVGGRNDGKTITVGAMREHSSYLMARTPTVKYDYVIIVAGMKYTIKKVYLMHDIVARVLAKNAKSGDEKDGRVTIEQLTSYRDNIGILVEW